MGQRYEHVCLVSLESVGVYSTYSAVGLLVTHTHISAIRSANT